MKKQTRVTLRRIAEGLLGFSVVFTALIGVVLKDPADVPTTAVLEWLVRHARDFGGYILVGLAVLTGIAKLSLWRMGQPWAHESIESVLEEICNHAFADSAASDPVHHHRVTLFKYRQWKWRFPFAAWRGWWPWGVRRGPRSGWLVPSVRSGHATQKMATIFLAPDDADSAEGIAGRAWQNKSTAYAADLPAITELSGDHNIARYANRTDMPEEMVRSWLRRGKQLPRALCGFPVLYEGVPLGVVVLDSRKPDGIKPPRETLAIFAMAQKLLPTLIRAA